MASQVSLILSSQTRLIFQAQKLKRCKALDGGDDGLDFYRAIFDKATAYLASKGKVCVEIGFGQEEAVSNIAAANGYADITVIKDLNQINRVVVGTLNT